MVKIEGNDIFRDGSKIGWVDGNHIWNRDGKKVGYFEENYIYNMGGDKMAYLEGDSLYAGNGGDKISLDNINQGMSGGVLPDIAKCAIYILL